MTTDSTGSGVTQHAAPSGDRFRHWRKTRPFWGGFFLMLSGFILFYSGNLDLLSLTVHLGPTGYLSYVIPLVVFLCGLLIWLSPGQRMFYSIIGLLSVLYSIIAVNLGGFLVGLINGLFGAALSFAWIPDKRTPVAIDGPGDETALGTEADTAELDEALWSPPAVEEEAQAGAGGDGGAVPAHELEPEGEQREPFRRPEHAVGGEPVAAAATPEPAAADAAEGETGSPGGEITGAGQPLARSDGSRDRRLWWLPAGYRRQPPQSAIMQPRRRAVLALAGLSLGVIVVVSFRDVTPARAESCLPTVQASKVEQLLKSQPATPRRAGSATGSRSSGKATGGKATGGDAVAAHVAGGPAVAVPVTDAEVVALSGIGLAPAADPTPSDGPTDSPSPGPTDTPTPTDPPTPTPTSTPTSTPTRTPTHTPTVTPTHTPTTTPEPSQSPSPSKSPRPSPSPSVTGPTGTPTPSPTGPCPVLRRALAAGAAAQNGVNSQPSTLTASTFTMNSPSYDGVVALPTPGGTVEAMQFSMTSSTAAPFQLVVAAGGGHTVTIGSTSLTVSGTVTFYASDIQGELDGTTVHFTPQDPPPSLAGETAVTFTGVTIALVYVQCDTLQAPGLAVATT